MIYWGIVINIKSIICFSELCMILLYFFLVLFYRFYFFFHLLHTLQVDVGCGVGGSSRFISKKWGTRGTGIITVKPSTSFGYLARWLYVGQSVQFLPLTLLYNLICPPTSFMYFIFLWFDLIVIFIKVFRYHLFKLEKQRNLQKSRVWVPRWNIEWQMLWKCLLLITRMT